MVTKRCHREYDAITGDGQRFEMTLIDPSDDKGNQGQPKQQKRVRPEYLAVNVHRRVQHVMMIVPKGADIQEAERVGEKDWQTRREGGQILLDGTLISSTMAITPVRKCFKAAPWGGAFRIGSCGDASHQLGIQGDLGVENL